MHQNVLAFLVSSFVCLAYLEFCKDLASRKVCRNATSRKLIHIGCGLQYLLLWPLYNDDRSAPFICGAVPLIATLRYLAVGLGLLEDKGLLLSTSRSGKREELLKGPVAYGIVHGLAAMIFWRHSAVGIATIAFLCAGDGLAEIVGTRLGTGNPLPFNPRKSWAGSLACFGGGFCAMSAFQHYFEWLNYLPPSSGKVMSSSKMLAVALAGGFVESLAIETWDNVTVSLTVTFASILLL